MAFCQKRRPPFVLFVYERDATLKTSKWWCDVQAMLTRNKADARLEIKRRRRCIRPNPMARYLLSWRCWLFTPVQLRRVHSVSYSLFPREHRLQLKPLFSREQRKLPATVLQADLVGSQKGLSSGLSLLAMERVECIGWKHHIRSTFRLRQFEIENLASHHVLVCAAQRLGPRFQIAK